MVDTVFGWLSTLPRHVIDPVQRRRRPEDWERWGRGRPMELWQMDVVRAFLLGDGTSAEA